MIPTHLIIEEERKRRERRADEGRIPLYAPSPGERRPAPRKERSDDAPSGGNVIIIDIGDYSEERR